MCVCLLSECRSPPPPPRAGSLLAGYLGICGRLASPGNGFWSPCLHRTGRGRDSIPGLSHTAKVSLGMLMATLRIMGHSREKTEQLLHRFTRAQLRSQFSFTAVEVAMGDFPPSVPSSVAAGLPSDEDATGTEGLLTVGSLANQRRPRQSNAVDRRAEGLLKGPAVLWSVGPSGSRAGRPGISWKEGLCPTVEATGCCCCSCSPHVWTNTPGLLRRAYTS